MVGYRLRVWFYNNGCESLRKINGFFRRIGRFFYKMSLPPSKTSLLYRRWYLKRQELIFLESVEQGTKKERSSSRPRSRG